MKYLNKQGNKFDNIRDAFAWCCAFHAYCCGCPLECLECGNPSACCARVEAYPEAAARLMGLEVIDEQIERRKKEMELKDTIEMMNSEDYKERFRAEYWQTKIRYEKLHKMCVKYEAGTLDFTPSCSLELLREQAGYMGNYLRTLEVRAEIEGISLDVLSKETVGKQWEAHTQNG